MTSTHYRSKSCGVVGLTEFNQNPFFHEDDEYEDEGNDAMTGMNPISTPFINPALRLGGKQSGKDGGGGNQFAVLDILVAALRKSLVTCSVERGDVNSMDISCPMEVRHVSHVTFDRFNGFLGLPTELQPQLPRRVPSASASVFGVSAKSMQCSYDNRGNSVPTILLMMQKRLYSQGGLKAEGIFRINAENSHREDVRGQLNLGVVPRGIDVNCLASLIKEWLRELPAGVLDTLTPEQVMHCNTEDDCAQLVKLLPPTESALLDWSINLMADVVEHEQYNKMNARNIAMVFAPNMTQMADPLTALIHAVQVMNLLKTLILKTLGERDKLEKIESHPANTNRLETSLEQTSNPCCLSESATDKFLRTSTLNRLETDIEQERWNLNEEKQSESSSGNNSPSPPSCKTLTSEKVTRAGNYESGEWLSLRKGVRKLRKHPVFQFSKPSKKTRSITIVNSRGEAWS